MDCSPLRYPIYIVSKGRFERPLTANFFLKTGVPFQIVVEPQEYDNYCKVIPKEHVLELPFANLGLGSYPARNFCWEQSLKLGFKRHFIFDDNIICFSRLNNGVRKKESNSLLALQALQEFADRFSNVAIAGYNYRYFVSKETKKPYHLNGHVYSGMLINNELPFRWRMKYNEDVDLCLQALHTHNWCTILLNVFLIDKVSTTAKMKGGNQTELYQNNDEMKKMLKSRSLQVVWPQYVKVVKRFGRPHHFINWKSHFKQPLIKKQEVHGMKLIQLSSGKPIARE
jgi:hypothetical protein